MIIDARFLVGGLATLVVLSVGGVARAEEKNPAMHRALHELRHTRTELKESAHDYGGHREKALLATGAAIKQIAVALHAAGDGEHHFKGHPAEVHKMHPHEPHMHHALHELHMAHNELKEAKHDFGGHREQALKDVDHAIEQLDLALKSAKK